MKKSISLLAVCFIAVGLFGVSCKKAVMRAVFDIPGLRAVILETYGSGNAPADSQFLEIISDGITKGIIIVNVTQCSSGSVEMERYNTGNSLKKIGVVSGYDITTEAAVTKLMILLGKNKDKEKVKKYFMQDLAGEITLPLKT